MNNAAALPIVLAADAHFSVPLAIAVETLLRAARETTRYDIYVLDDGVLEMAKRHIETLKGRFDFRITYFPVQQIVQGVATKHYFPRVSFARFFIPQLLPEGTQKVFYSDADVMFCDDLSDLYSMDMQGHAMAGIQELGMIAVEHRSYLYRWRDVFHLDLDARGWCYCNSGNILFDCPLWKERGYTQKIIDMACGPQGRDSHFPDQDIMNAVCWCDIVPMELRYCIIPRYVNRYCTDNPREMYGGLCRYTPEYMRQQYGNPALIHFAGQKPRVLEGPRYPLEERFIEFWKQSAWRDYMPFNPRVGSYSPSRFIKQNVPISAQLGILRRELLKYTAASLLPLPKRRHYAEQRNGLRTVLRNAGA